MTLKTNRQKLSNLFLKLQLDIKTQIKIQNFKPKCKHTYKYHVSTKLRHTESKTSNKRKQI
jgi:hypothetical protein